MKEKGVNDVIISPFPSSKDLRLEDYGSQDIPVPAADNAPEPMPEIEGILTPVS